MQTRFVSELMKRSAEGDSAASNVLDMIDGNENGAASASDAQLREWYDAGAERDHLREAAAERAERARCEPDF